MTYNMVHFWVFLSTSNVTVGMARAASFLRTIPDWSKLWIFYWWIFFSNFIWSRDYSSLPIPSSLRNSSKFSLFCNLHSPVATEKCPFIFFVDSVRKRIEVDDLKTIIILQKLFKVTQVQSSPVSFEGFLSCLKIDLHFPRMWPCFFFLLS